MNILKKIVAFACVAIMLCVQNTTFATETEEAFDGSCELTIVMVDDTKKYDGNIVMELKSSSDSYTINFNNASSWGSKKKKMTKQVKAPALYNISFTINKGYKVGYTSDKFEVDTINIEEDEEIELDLSIIVDEDYKPETDNSADKNTEKASENTATDSTATESQNTATENQNAENNSEVSASDTSEASTPDGEISTPAKSALENTEEKTLTKEDAEAAYKEFLDNVSFIKTDESWTNFLELYELNETVDSESYCIAVAGGTENQYADLSSFDKFVYTRTYTEVTLLIYNGMRDTYFGSDSSFDTFKSLILDSPLNLMETMGGADYDKVQNAYVKLMEFQYNYILQNGYAFNFADNMSYLEEQLAEPSADISADTSAVDVVEDDTSTEKSENIWGRTFDKLAGHFVTVLLLIVLIAALVAVIYIRRKNNIDDLTN